MMGALQPWHLFVILVIVLMVFGPGKLPQVGRAVGDGLRELKRSANPEAPVEAPPSLPLRPNACPGCGLAVAPGQHFCGACGAPLVPAGPRAA